MTERVSERAHLSIGEVLALLQSEFPDVTISKIRFLESQGLLDPERTPSGYRKFYDADVARLRWILRQQREHFLPLKVIKDRLAETPPDQVPDDRPAPPQAAAADAAVAPADAGETPEAAPADSPAGTKPTPAPAPATDTGAPAGPGAGSVPRRALLDAGVSAASLTLEELAASSALTVGAIAELERFGMLQGRQVGPDFLYDEDALVVARLAAAFRRFGVEARHLKMYRTSAEREASFFETVVMPMLKQRNPAARRQAFDALGELAELGEALRAAMLRQALREYSGQQ